jgi:hypothetical protein
MSLLARAFIRDFRAAMCSLTVKSISTPVPKIPNHQNDDRHYRDNDDNLFHRHSQNIRLTGFGVSAFEVESVTRKREAYATQAQGRRRLTVRTCSAGRPARLYDSQILVSNSATLAVMSWLLPVSLARETSPLSSYSGSSALVFHPHITS